MLDVKRKIKKIRFRIKQGPAGEAKTMYRHSILLQDTSDSSKKFVVSFDVFLPNDTTIVYFDELYELLPDVSFLCSGSFLASGMRGNIATASLIIIGDHISTLGGIRVDEYGNMQMVTLELTPLLTDEASVMDIVTECPISKEV